MGAETEDGTGHIIATYREIATHFGLKGVVQARVKAKRAGWEAEPQNHPADALRLRVPRKAWDARFQAHAEPLPRKPVEPRNLSLPTPDFRKEIGGIVKGFDAALGILREQLEQERERANRAEGAIGQERAKREAAEGDAARERQAREAAEAARVAAEAAQEAAEAERDAAERVLSGSSTRPWWAFWWKDGG
jgi:hypothetical protein